MAHFDSDDPRERLQAVYAQLPPELRRAAGWVAANMPQAALWSMRRQAQEVGVAPATMLRLARAGGYDSYQAFRAACQQAATGGLRRKAARLQAAQSEAPMLDALTAQQTQAVQSVRQATPAPAMDAAADALLRARLVGFLGTRSSFGIASQMHYGYQLLRGNGLLLDCVGGAPAEQADALQAGDALVAISQAPYTMLTAHTARRCAQRGVAVVALTDSARSPVAEHAAHILLFIPPGPLQGPASFFHTTTGLLALAEHLLARLAARGGDAILTRLAEVEARLHDEHAYWAAAAPGAAHRAAPSSPAAPTLT